MSESKVQNKFLFRLSILSFLLIGVVTNHILPESLYNRQINVKDPSWNKKAEVQAWWGSQEPSIYISSGNYGYSSGGLIPLASTDDPVVSVRTYNTKGTAKYELYEADRQAIFDYLLYSEENEQINPELDTSGFEKLTEFEEMWDEDSDEVSLPLEDSGIYYLKLSIDDVTAGALIVRSNIGSVVQEGRDELIFWSQDFRTKRSLSSGNMRLYNFKDESRELVNVSVNDEGVSITNLNPEADVAFLEQGDDLAVIPINLRYLNTGWRYDRFREFQIDKRYFNFTDRPLYRPGDTVYFKSIIRDEDDVRYSIPSGSVEVVLTGGGDDPIYQENLPISSLGTITGEIDLPEDIATGYYSLNIDGDNWENRVSIQVQNFRKPEYFLSLETQRREYTAGDEIKAVVRGEYFSGQPLSGVNVRYKVYSSNYYDYQYYDHIGRQISDDYRYRWYRRDSVSTGLIELDEQGVAEISIDTQAAETDGRPQVYSVEVNYQGASSDQSFDRKNILVYPGEFGIYRDNYQWSVRTGDNINIDYRLHPYKDQVSVSNREVNVKVDAEVYEEGERRYYNRNYETVLEQKFTTDSLGKFSLGYTPERKGRYKIFVSATDDIGNFITKEFSFYAADRQYRRYNAQNTSGLSLTPDRELYKPGDQASVVLYSEIPNRDVFVSFNRARVNRYQVVSLEGNTTTLELPLVDTDMPNIYLTAASFGNDRLHSATEDLEVSAEQMRIQVEISPDSAKYGPGDTAVVDITTRDINGNPVAADVAVWAVDKAIYELEQDPLDSIFEEFWDHRYNSTVGGHSLEGIVVRQSEGGGCFAPGTKILMDDGTEKNIEDVVAGDTILTKADPMSEELVSAKVTETTQKTSSGFLLINGTLRITDNHVLLINGKWKEAGDIRTGDILATKSGTEEVKSIEWHLGETKVYNLEIEKYHTFFADGIYVHNQKGGMAREVLEDTAYWNPSVWTGDDGRARVTINLPDNLTTWAVAAVAATSDTRVGLQRSEIQVTKDLIVRPILPNVMREGDKITLSALAQNFTDEDKVFNIRLDFNAGEVTEPEKTNIKIKSQGTQQLYWEVSPTQIDEEAEIQFVMYEPDDENSGDNIIQTIPVRRFGFKEVAGYSGIGGQEYKVNLHEDSLNEQTEVKLNLSPTVLGSLPASMNYLIDYPYGCVEQTTSRFVPTVIVKQNQSLFPDIVEEKDIDGIIEEGISRLGSLQNNDGSWGWWGGGSGNTYISAYVVEYLLEARDLGYEVEDNILNNARRYFENIKNPEDSLEDYDRIPRYYALTLLDSDKGPRQMAPKNDTNDFLLSMLVIANKKNGINDNTANGYNELIRRARYEGDSVYWQNVGASGYFASPDAATAMAVRAILEAGGERDLAVRAVDYLSRSKDKHYWINTHATANAVRAIVDLSLTGNEQSPNYTYEIRIDDEVLSTGRVNSADQIIRQIEVPVDVLGSEDVSISINKNGNGQLYSTLVVEEFRTDPDFIPQGKALKITRKYTNANDPYKTLAVGEVAEITLTIEGLSGNSEYIVVEDTLPSGMVPVIENFKNEQYDQNRSYSWAKEYKDDGIIFSRSYWSWGSNSDKRVLSYRARVINAGEFSVPPAYTELMYTPEINGLSSIESIRITQETSDLPRPPFQSSADGIGSLIKNAARNELVSVGIIIMSLLLAIEQISGIFSKKLKRLRAKLSKRNRKDIKVDKNKKGKDDRSDDKPQNKIASDS